MAIKRTEQPFSKGINPGIELDYSFQNDFSFIEGLGQGWIFWTEIIWSPCGRYLASSAQTGSIFVWEMKTKLCVAVMAGVADGFDSEDRSEYFPWKRIAWSPDSKVIAVLHNDHIVFWDFNLDKTSISAHPKVIDVPQAIAKMAGKNDEFFSLSWANDIIAIGSQSGVNFYHYKNREFFRPFQKAKVSGAPVVVFSAKGDFLAIGNEDGVVVLSPLDDQFSNRFLDPRLVYGTAWSPGNSFLAISGSEPGIRIWNLNNESCHILEGHTETVNSLSYSADGQLLASASRDNTVRIWHVRNWMTVVKLYDINSANATFHPTKPILATLSKDCRTLCIWRINPEVLSSNLPLEKPVRYTSAKIVLVGESNIGKSSLAMRLAEDRYPKPEEQGTTHGMRFWSMEADKLHLSAKPSRGQRRDIVLWDFGGQDEYRLVHQLFLHDTTLALILIDPTRGRVAFEEAQEWNKSLEKQFAGRKAIKFLVGAKMDKSSKLVDPKTIEKLCQECGFIGYLETSALTGRNIKKFRKALASSLDWENLAMTSRPELFQHIRDEIENRRKKKDVVLVLDDLVETIRRTYKGEFDPDAVIAVSEQLAVQGVIALTKLTGGEDVLILQLPVIERYAGSIIVAARNNPRGVPALEERLLGSAQIPLPGMTRKDRVPLMQEKIVLECIVELLIRHGICYRHQQLLVFPTLFVTTEADKAEKLPHSVSLYYDFTGAIDNIYASLVAKLAVSEAFGESRLYPSRVEFDAPGKGVCGIQHIKYKGGQAHIDLFFGERTDVQRRRLFTGFVEDHLREHGVEVREHEAIKCRGCNRDISEEVIHANIAAGQQDVVCQWCRTHTQISEGVAKIRERDPQSAQKIFALRKEIEKRTTKDVEKAKLAVSTTRISKLSEPVRLLHLSDLHFTKTTSPRAKLQWLLQDIRKGESLGFDSVEYVVVSGDVTDKGNEEGFEKAREFVSLLNEEFGISAERCIFVPGNHDVQDLEEAYDWCGSEAKAKTLEPDTSLWHREGSVVFVPNKDKYSLRLKKYSDAFFHKIIAKPYPLDARQQGIAYLFPSVGIQFLTLNSCWQIDQFNRKRSGIHSDALANVISEADKQVKEAVKSGDMKRGQNPLRIGVWHHSVAHIETIKNTDFIDHLQNAGVKVCLHGDVHEANRELVKYWHPQKMHVAGTGSFGSVAEGRPESTPRLYNLIELQRDFSSVRVHTRQQPKPDGAWSGWNEWLRDDGGPGRIPWYDIKLK